MIATGTVRAHWSTHVNRVRPTRAMRAWLTDKESLTVKLVAHSNRFQVQRLHQRQSRCMADECRAIGLQRPLRVREREVLLRCDGRATVFAHTIVPMQATANDWPFFNALGERSLGLTLFGDPRVVRGALHFARLSPRHPLVRRARAATEFPLQSAVYARRCLFRRKRGCLLVTELFLPPISDLEMGNGSGPIT